MGIFESVLKIGIFSSGFIRLTKISSEVDFLKIKIVFLEVKIEVLVFTTN